MPQMAPMSWLTLFIYFLTIFIFLNYLNYFTFMKTETNKSFTKMTKFLSWKW